MATRGSPVTPTEACLENLRLFVEERLDPDALWDGSHPAASLSEFLALCAQSLSAGPAAGGGPPSAALCHARDVFVRGGLEALAARRSHAGNSWFQIGIRPQHADLEARGELCRQVASVARTVLSDSLADDFFFMNKPPGMRLRFQAAAGTDPGHLADVVNAQVMRWRADRLINHVEHGVYEPENQLFGGPASMKFVHALFTVDSLMWLDYHACRADEGDAISPAWLVSLTALQTVFAGLEIVGWEDIGVWECIREVAGRRLRQDKESVPLFPEVSGELREAWSRRNRLSAEAAVPAIVAAYDSALLEGAARWRSGYFCRPGASLGARAAAAFYVIFHWNRAGLSSSEQALLAESLSERMLHDVRR
jgi:thiopeptide-type bacteriocin biosynthesis domain